MKNHVVSKSGAFLSLAALLLGSSARAYISDQDFEKSVSSAWNEILGAAHSARNFKEFDPFDRPKLRILEHSRRIFRRFPKTERSLLHLDPLANSGIKTAYHWDQYNDFEDSLLETLREYSPEGTSPLRDQVSLIGASMMWHEIQHTYDRIELEKNRGRIARLVFQSLEMEQRGWEAGCRVWRSGLKIGPEEGSYDLPDLFRCEESFPTTYYCRYSLAVEYVVMLARQIAAEEEAPARLLDALSAYCVEFERAQKGNPLSLKAFTFEWNKEDCMRHALDTVLDPQWESSLDRCPALIKSGPDVREAAVELMMGIAGPPPVEARAVQ